MFALRRNLRSVGDDFNRANGTLGANWTDRNGAGAIIASNALSNSTAGFFPVQYNKMPASGPDQFISGIIGALGANNGYNNILFARTPLSSTSGTWACLFINNLQMQIATMTSWAAASFTARTALANSNGGSAMAVGARVTLAVVNNVWQAYYNGTPVGTSWSDTTPVIPAANLYGGSGVSAGGAPMPTFDAVRFGDYLPGAVLL